MNKQPNSNPDADKFLDAAINEIRHQAIPPFPAVQTKIPHRSTAFFGSATRNRILSIGIPVLATTAAILVIGIFVLLPAASKTAFAQVQEALLQVKTLQYTVLDRHENWMSKPKTFESRTITVEPHWSRAESEHAGIWISDMKQERQLNINHDSRTATFHETQSSIESMAKRLEFLDKFRHIPTHATRRIGETDFNGTPAEQFYVQLGNREFLVTVNSKTKLPLQMEYNSDGFQKVFTDFVFDEEINMGLFALEAPKGYKVIVHQLSEPPKFASSLVVSPESGIDDCDFGSSVEEVIGHLGEPSGRENHEDIDPVGDVHSSTTLNYSSLGLRVFFNTNGLASMLCQSQVRSGSTVHDFAGKTDKGLGIGDSRDKLIKIYGEPDFENEETVRYIRKGISFYLQDASVSGINILQPLDPALKFEVDPKTGAQRTWIGEIDD